MSSAKKDRVFPTPVLKLVDDEFAQLISEALRKDYADLPSAVKQIGLQTGANLRAIRNWYEGRHAPSSFHLLALAKSSPSILRLVLTQIGGKDLLEAFQILSSNTPEKSAIITDKIVSDDDMGKPELSKLNRRQLWFYSQVKHGQYVSAQSIAQRWDVDVRTAWRDISRLSNLKLIHFHGSKKNGKYIVK